MSKPGHLYALSSASRSMFEDVFAPSSGSMSNTMPGIVHAPACADPPKTLECGFLASVDHWVLPSRLRAPPRQFFHQSVECLEWTLDLISLQDAGTQSCTVSLRLDFQRVLHSTWPRLGHAQSQLRLHEHPSYMYGVGLLLSVQKLRGW